jgi:hypothetical protein
MATRAIGKEVELLLLDAVCHPAALTVNVFVQLLCFTRDIAHHEAALNHAIRNPDKTASLRLPDTRSQRHFADAIGARNLR